MIRSFRHRGLERFFTRDDWRGIPARHGACLERMLDRLDAAKARRYEPAGLPFPPAEGQTQRHLCRDLAERLVGLLETYKRNKAQPPMKERLDEHERRLMAQVHCNLLFRWFIGLGMDDAV